MSEIKIKIDNTNIIKNISGIIAEALVQYQLDKLKNSVLEYGNELNYINDKSEMQMRLHNILRAEEQRNMTKEEMDKFFMKTVPKQMNTLLTDIMFEHIKNQKLQKEINMEPRTNKIKTKINLKEEV